jgi:hypothetical protein
MNACPDDPTLLTHATGEGDAATRAHVLQCLPCAARLQTLRADLSLLRDALGRGPLPRRAAAPPAWRPHRWAVPLAAAAIALLAFAWSRSAPPASAPLPSAQLANLGADVSAALFASREGFGTVAQLSDREMLAAALNGALPCDSRDPYGAGCSYADLLDR